MGDGAPNPEIQQPPEISQLRTHIMEAINQALGPDLRSTEDTSFEGHIGAAHVSNLKMAHIPKERQEAETQPSGWKIRLDNYRATPGEAEGPVMDINGLSNSVVELTLDEEDPSKDVVRINPSIIIAMEHALSPRGIIEGARFASNEGREVTIPTQEEAEERSRKLRAEYFERYKDDFARATSRTPPTLNDYLVFDEAANFIDRFIELYGEDNFRARKKE